MIIISYYTKDTPYEDIVKNLVSSIEKHGYSYHLYPIDNQGSWLANCAMKPSIILQALEKFDDDILYVDADAEIKDTLEFFESFAGEIGVHYRDDTELLSGTIFLRNNNNVKRVIRLWEQSQTNDIMDQKVLQKILDENRLTIDTVNIPANYTQIFDSMKHHGKPIIEHYQASRIHRNSIPTNSIIPNIISGMRTRKHDSHTFSLPRASKSLQKTLDKKYIRMPGELTWVLRPSYR